MKKAQCIFCNKLFDINEMKDTAEGLMCFECENDMWGQDLDGEESDFAKGTLDAYDLEFGN